MHRASCCDIDASCRPTIQAWTSPMIMVLSSQQVFVWIDPTPLSTCRFQEPEGASEKHNEHKQHLHPQYTDQDGPIRYRGRGQLAWIERFLLKTSLTWRKKDESQPYHAAFPTEKVVSTSASINLHRILADCREDKAFFRSTIIAQNIRIHNILTKMDLCDT